MSIASRIKQLSVAAVALHFAACSTSVVNNECFDGIDNDNDGFYDGADPGCIENFSKESPDPDIPACSDGADNDKDGLLDFEDPGCFNLLDNDEYDEPVPACRDGIDNDGDGLYDYPNDPGCLLNLEDSEEDDCPDGDSCPPCSNGVDDDGDGFIDFPDDPGCDSAGDTDEFSSDPSICGASVRLEDLSPDGTTLGRLRREESNDLISPECGGAGSEAVYEFSLDKPRALSASTNVEQTTIDTVLYVRQECRDPATELGCADDVTPNGPSELFIERIEPGDFYLVVDSFRANRSGDFTLLTEFTIPRGEPCGPVGDSCSPGLVCRKLTPDAPEETCEFPECRDGLDNDGDGKTDFPVEPGCETPDDNTELDDCPDGPGCPECSNGVDDDFDTLVDFPDDPGCSSAADTFEIDPCGPIDKVEQISFGVLNGNTSGDSAFSPSCSFGGNDPEAVHGLVINRDLISVTFSTLGSTFDTITSVKFASCDNDDLACEDPDSEGETVTIESPEQGAYYVFVDGNFGSGDYVLEVTGVIPGGDACDVAVPALACEEGFFCDATTSICELAACNDQNDNDGDGKTDFPNEPGCESPSDNDETDDCPDGPGCPECSNEIDDDADGIIDFGDDVGCVSAGDTSENDCDAETDEILRVTEGTSTASTNGFNNDSQGTCGGSFGVDRLHTLKVTSELESLRVDTAGSTLDTVIYVRGPDECGAEELGCNDENQDVPSGNSLVELDEVSPGVYFIFIDSFSGQGDYTLNVRGVIKGGEACEDALIQNGLYECAEGFDCRDGVCAQAPCNNGQDDDGDGKTDFPDDPGCESPSDGDETDDCPGGAGCPICSNGQDDDGDGKTDFPDDPGCSFAADGLELDPCTPDTDISRLEDVGVTGTTSIASAGSNFQGSCTFSNNATEDVYLYENKRELESLSVVVTNATRDINVYARTGVCSDPASEVACVNEEFNGQETMVIEQPELAEYYIFVDGGFGGLIDYDLALEGQIGVGAACDAASTQFVCTPGNACVGGVCTPSKCSNGIDDDGDGLADEFDPGCESINDDTEAPDPTPLPACADGQDNDSDGRTDFGFDAGCERASDDEENDCVNETDPVVLLGGPSVSGNTGTATNDSAPTCSQFANSQEIVHAVIFPGALDSLTASLSGFSFSVLEIRQGSCEGESLACETGFSAPEIELQSLPAGPYFLIVDGDFATGAFTLDVSGVISAGENCDPTQISSGLLECAQGTVCNAGICQPAP